MSEPEKRKPVSIYLTPKAAMVLREYNMGSGYGSASRTVEEIILAFDVVYKNMLAFMQFMKASKGAKLSQKQKAENYLMLANMLININNAISRLQSASALSPQV